MRRGQMSIVDRGIRLQQGGKKTIGDGTPAQILSPRVGQVAEQAGADRLMNLLYAPDHAPRSFRAWTIWPRW
jgi:hypothetical protein